MAFIRCLSGNSQKFKETVLWTNPDPTSDFETQTITLSDDMTNYDFLRIEGKAHKNDTVDTLEVYAVPTYLFTCSLSKSNLAGGCALGSSSGSGSTGARHARAMNASSSTPTKMTFGAQYSLATTTSNNAWEIPTRVVGIKY